MRFVKILGPAGLLVALLLSWCGAEAKDPILQEHGPARALAQDQRVAELSRFEPTGLSILRPYAKGQIPVVFIHYQKPFELEVTGCRSIMTRLIAWSWTSRIVNSTPS